MHCWMSILLNLLILRLHKRKQFNALVKTWSSRLQLPTPCFNFSELNLLTNNRGGISRKTVSWKKKRKRKMIQTIRPFQICQDSNSHSATDNLSCLPASNTMKALSRCLSQRWFPRQQEYDNVAFDMTEGIISLTNRDNRHREGWGRGRGGGWINGLIFTQRKKQQQQQLLTILHPPSSSIASNAFLLADTLVPSQGNSQPPLES